MLGSSNSSSKFRDLEFWGLGVSLGDVAVQGFRFF